MAAPSLLLDFALVLIAAEIGGALFRVLRMPRPVGMLIAGIALGPFTPGYAVDPANIQGLALLGVVFLLFSAGLSFDIRGFRRLGLWPFLLAGLGVGASFAAGLGIGLLAGWDVLASTFLGLILTHTSSALALKLLADAGLAGERGADLITAAILVDDLVALSLLTVAVGLAGPSPVPFSSLVLGLVGILALAALLVFVATHALPPVLRATNAVSPSSLVMVAVSFALLIAFAFALLGLPPLVGAFFAGSIVASTEYGPRVARHIAPVTAIFMAVFFASVGLLINPGLLPGVAVIGLAVALVAAFAKIVAGMSVLRRAAGVSGIAGLSLATVLVPRAEISLIIAQYGVSLGESRELLAVAMIVMVATALFPGAFLPLIRSASARAARRKEAAASVDPASPMPGDREG